jgi:hypothetical protein
MVSTETVRDVVLASVLTCVCGGRVPKIGCSVVLTPDLSVEVATVNLHSARSCSIRDASQKRGERKVCAVRRKASGVEAWRWCVM